MIRILLLTIVSINACNGARILGIVPTSSYSHQVFFHPLWRELSIRGHELVVLTTDPINDPTLKNLKEINLHGAYKIFNKEIAKVVEESKVNELNAFFIMISAFEAVTEWELQHPEVQALIKNETEHFDLVMIENLLPSMYAFQQKFNCPFIGITSLDSPAFFHQVVGNAVHVLMYPEAYMNYDENPGFITRVNNILGFTIVKTYCDYFMTARQQVLVEKIFGKGYDLFKIIENFDMLFINANPIFAYNRPLSPSTINIGGGSHIKELKPLPKDLGEFLDGAKNGFIYFSLGTNVKSVNIPDETRQVLLKVFSEIPYRVLWKFDEGDFTKMPDNVKIVKWAPQHDILRHPNIKAFITQCGIQSLEEALLSGVPLLGMPFIADQFGNAKKIKSNGLGLTIDYRTMTAKTLNETIYELILNPNFKIKAKQLAELVKDQPMTGLEKAVWWTEYVLRHKGGKHLRGPKYLPFYQYYYLDIIALAFILIGSIIALSYFIISKSVKIICALVNKNKIKTQ